MGRINTKDVQAVSPFPAWWGKGGDDFSNAACYFALHYASLQSLEYDRQDIPTKSFFDRLERVIEDLQFLSREREIISGHFEGGGK